MRRSVATAVLTALALVGLTAAPAAAAESFTEPPASLAGAPGALIRSAPMKLAASVSFGGSLASLPGTATQIMYETTDADGEPAAATGVYIEPAARWWGGGERPLVSFAAGTQGQGDACAPRARCSRASSSTPTRSPSATRSPTSTRSSPAASPWS